MKQTKVEPRENAHREHDFSHPTGGGRGGRGGGGGGGGGGGRGGAQNFWRPEFKASEMPRLPLHTTSYGVPRTQLHIARTND